LIHHSRGFKVFAGFLLFATITTATIRFSRLAGRRNSKPTASAQALLDHADTLAWGNRWADAQPLYNRAEQLFLNQHQLSKALYARVSQVPSDESGDIQATILALDRDLTRPEAADPETRLRILVIRGMLEINFDASDARATWQQVADLARQRNHYELATRAVGEQGIAAFLLGDTEKAKRQVLLAWGLSKAEGDPAATVRYESMFGEGLVHLNRFKEALEPLNESIHIAANHPEVAYPTIAVYAKIEALAGLHQYDQALALANESLARLKATPYDGHKAQVYITRGVVNQDRGDWASAISDFKTGLAYSTKIGTYRGMTDAGGLLAAAYERQGDLRDALDAIDAAIQANTKIPDELYLVPRNLAIKADITNKMGNASDADVLYQKSIVLVNGMIQHAPTVNIQRQLLAEMSNIYSGYFASLCSRKRYNEALQALEEVRGRVETEALEHHANQPLRPLTEQDRQLTRLNIALINSDDPATRQSLTKEIYNAELKLSPSALAQETTAHPVKLAELQRRLPPTALLIEYVLAEPNSYALAITRSTVTPYRLASKGHIEADANQYRRELNAEKTDMALGQALFNELLAPIKDYPRKSDLTVVPDGALHLLPFAALTNKGAYVLATHTVDVVPSSTVFELLRKRVDKRILDTMPYIGVAAWTQTVDTRNLVLRAIAGPERSQLVPLPESKKEVETVAQDLPQPNTVLLGADATEGRFKDLPLDSTGVIHLALHGYADEDYPDRSALIFAPDPTGAEDGLLQVREIRNLHLDAKLVTLSACDTGVGPTGEADVANIVNAFIEAGADTVVSTLWELEDHSTEHLMSTFYSQLALHHRKVDALRTAQLDLLNQGLPPYYWASFQIVGDPDGTI
jgi:CHAT domain-containing protein